MDKKEVIFLMDSRIEIKDILNKVYRYCSKAEKCEYDIKKYIDFFDIAESDKQKIIDKLYFEDFLNKERYIKAFVNDKIKFNKWGKTKILNELLLKQFDKHLIIFYLNNINKDDYLLMIKNVLKTKSKQIKKKDDFSYRNSLIRFGLSRGFDYENIEKAMNELNS